ncbi:hypothetical protein P3383_23675, partial [Vibrio parahaemolyticus]|nr:hypothetical protein [Vibrio parahaemolyticus]
QLYFDPVFISPGCSHALLVKYRHFVTDPQRQTLTKKLLAVIVSWRCRGNTAGQQPKLKLQKSK